MGRAKRARTVSTKATQPQRDRPRAQRPLREIDERASLIAIASVTPRICPALWAHLTLIAPQRHARSNYSGVPRDDRGELRALIDAGELRDDAGDLVWSDQALRLDRDRSLSIDAPRTWQRAHVDCAAFFERRGAEGDLLLAVEHLLAVGDTSAAVSLVARWGPSALDVRWLGSLPLVLDRLVAGDAPMPSFVHWLRARVLERKGDLLGALDTLERAIAASANRAGRGLDRTQKLVSTWLPRPVQMASAAGLLAVRVGQIQRASRLLDEARRLAKDDTVASVEQLAARLALVRGDLPVAVRGFQRAARAAALARDAGDEAEALSGLGVVAMRAGEPRRAAEHYRQALACGGGADLRVARIQANLAMALSLTGQFVEAISLFDDAAATRERLGDLAGAANSSAAGAGAREGAGDLDGARAALARARHLAALVGDAPLLLEIHLLRANLALREREVAAGRAALREARAVRATLEQPDALLDAMIDESEGELALASGKPVDAARSARRALRVASRHGASYIVARVHLLLARNALNAGRTQLVQRHLASAVARASASGLRFAHAWCFARVLETGVGHPDPAVVAYCREALGHENEPLARALPRGVAPFRVIDRSGVRLASAAEVDRLRKHPPALLVDLPRQLVFSPRGAVHASGKRVLIPLLLVFLERPSEAFDHARIHREVWGIDRLDDAARTRLKVALSRLRAQIGPGIVETRRVIDTTGAQQALFALAPGVEFAVIDQG